MESIKTIALILSFLFIVPFSFAQNTCEQSFSQASGQELKKQVEAQGSVRGGVAVNRKAEIKLQQDLQIIRRSPQEPLLKKRGFTPEYYEGVDQVREFNRVREYLKEINADPKRTHISYFADQIKKTLADFSASFNKEKNKHKKEFIKARLNLLKALKKEAYSRIENQEVTYDWWADFNFRLVFLITPMKVIKKTIAKNSSITVEDFRTDKKFKDFIMKYLHKSEELNVFQFIKSKFPKAVMFFSTDNFGIMAFNRTEGRSLIVNVSGENKSADSTVYHPFGLFLHDIRHNGVILPVTKETNRKLIKKLNSIANTSIQKKAELALFVFQHETGHIGYVIVADKNVFLNRNLRDRIVILSAAMIHFFKSLRAKHGGGRSIILLSAFIKDHFRSRFLLFPGGDFRYEELLPNSLQGEKTREKKQKLKMFRNEVIDIFMQYFSEIFIIKGAQNPLQDWTNH